jgi:hypothetical protein
MVVGVLVALGIGSVPAASQAPIGSGRIGHRRVERTFIFSEGWESSCEGDSCGISILFQVPVRTPRTTPRVDVTMTATFDYRTGPGPTDYAEAGAGFSNGRRGFRLRPGWPLGPAPQRTSTTLVWQRRDVPAAGRRYRFQMSVPSREGGTGNRNFVRGRRATVVVEMWPAGR